jgi:hypothetical protein
MTVAEGKIFATMGKASTSVLCACVRVCECVYLCVFYLYIFWCVLIHNEQRKKEKSKLMVMEENNYGLIFYFFFFWFCSVCVLINMKQKKQTYDHGDGV